MPAPSDTDLPMRRLRLPHTLSVPAEMLRQHCGHRMHAALAAASRQADRQSPQHHVGERTCALLFHREHGLRQMSWWSAPIRAASAGCFDQLKYVAIPRAVGVDQVCHQPDVDAQTPGLPGAVHFRYRVKSPPIKPPGSGKSGRDAAGFDRRSVLQTVSTRSSAIER